MDTIEKLQLHRLSIPLTTPYKLAFGPVIAFDTIIARVLGADGREGFGEATILTGYTSETINRAWRIAGELAAVMVGGLGMIPVLGNGVSREPG
jgi:L-alanine-DL-glutamate epimerase-like enolase superfamily enzyme